jgi:DNA-binding transcriptional ArsR family regulator
MLDYVKRVRLDASMSAKHVKMPAPVLGQVARRFAMLGDPTRLSILQSLMGGELPVNGIVEAVGASQANVSRHLKGLHDGGLVLRRRQGIQVYYSIGDPCLFQLCEIVCSSVTRKASTDAAALAMPGVGRGKSRS